MAPAQTDTFTPQDDSQAKYLEKVRLLLAKAESTNSEHEALACIEKANALMESFAISQAMLDYANDSTTKKARGVPVIRKIDLSDGPSNIPELYLLNYIAKANRCECWYTREFSTVPNPNYGKLNKRGNIDYNANLPREKKIGNVAGFESDIAYVELLFTSLCVQMNTALLRPEKEATINTNGKGKGNGGGLKLKMVTKDEVKGGALWRQEFMQGYATRIGERLKEQAHTREEMRDESQSLVLVNRKTEVREFMAEQGIHLGGRSRSLTTNNYMAAQSAGRSAANSANLSAGGGTFKGSAKQLNS
jgi:Protein of unknown function (DUF2786)